MRVRRRGRLVALAVVLIAVVAAGSAALFAAGSEFQLGTPVVNCAGPSVQLTWTDTQPGYYRTMARRAGQGDEAWIWGGWTAVNARTATAPAVNGVVMEYEVQAWTDHYRSSNLMSAPINCGTGPATTTTRPATTTTRQTTTTRPATTTTRPATTTTRPATTTTRPATTTTRPATTTTTRPAAGGGPAWSIGNTGSDAGYEVETDSDGNAFVAGSFNGTITIGTTNLTSAGDADIFLAKYAPNGSALWARRMGSANGEFPRDRAVGANGNVTITSAFSGTASYGGTPLASAGGTDIVVAQYKGADGAHVWSKRFGGTQSDIGEGVDVDGAGNVYVTGAMSGRVDFGGGELHVPFDTDLDIFVLKLDKDGNHVWSKNFPNDANDAGKGIAVDAAGNVTIIGSLFNSINFTGQPVGSPGTLSSPGSMTDIIVAHFSTTGVHVWSKQIGSSIRHDTPDAIDVDANGNPLVLGQSGGDVNLGGGAGNRDDADAFVVKLSALTGAHQWSARLGGPSGILYGRSVSVSANTGRVLIGGYFQGSVDIAGRGYTSLVGSDDAFFAEYNSDGSPNWAKSYGGRDSEQIQGVATTPTGTVWGAGYFYGSAAWEGITLTSRGAADAAFVRTTP